jgi:hypothetical protein
VTPARERAVRSAWLINGPAALDVLSRHGTDERPQVQEELITGWEYFEPETYARRVLDETPWCGGQLILRTTRVLPGPPHVGKCNDLRIASDTPTVDLAFLRRISPLDAARPGQELRNADRLSPRCRVVWDKGLDIIFFFVY